MGIRASLRRSARRPGLAATSLLAAALAAACTFTPSGGSTFSEALFLYETADAKKAIALAAVTQGNRRRSAWGVATGAVTQDYANEKALEACARNARRAGIEAPCHLFAVGDAPARDTVAACRAGRLDPYRCELQQRHAGALREGSGEG